MKRKQKMNSKLYYNKLEKHEQFGHSKTMCNEREHF